MVADSPTGAPSNRLLYPLIALLLALSVGAQVVRDRGWQPYYPADPPMWIQSGPVMKKLALGYDSVVADVYWMRAVVYYGDRRLQQGGGQRSYALLDPLLKLVTTLDPHFRVAYRFGAIFLAEGYPAGAGRPDLGIALLTRAIEQDTPRWDYYHDIGFIYYWWLRDYASAAEWFEKAADRPGAAAWLRPLAATTLAVGGDRASSRTLWTQLRDNSDSDWIRRNADHRLKQLDALDIIAELEQKLVARFHERIGRFPSSWRELAAAANLKGVPLDPSGVPFELDPATGRIDVSKTSVLWPLPAPASEPPSAPK